MSSKKNFILKQWPCHQRGSAPYCREPSQLKIYVAPDGTKPQRREVKEGDVRVLLAKVSTGKRAAFVFSQGFWQKKKDGTNPHTITSPVAKVHFDQITEVPGIQIAYKEGGKDEKTGKIRYGVEVAIPLASLRLKDVAGKTIAFDASVGIANETGNKRLRAVH